MQDIGLDAMDIRRIEAEILNAGSDMDQRPRPLLSVLEASSPMRATSSAGQRLKRRTDACDCRALHARPPKP